MNKILLFAFLCLTAACGKKDKLVPEPIVPEETANTTEDTLHFVKEVVVPGASEVVVDSLSRSILITLPESYTKDEITFKLKFFAGAAIPYGDALPSPDQFEFFFKNHVPFMFDVTNASRATRSFRVFVRHEGPIKATIDQTDAPRPVNGGNVSIPIVIISGLGTMPETPASKDSLSIVLGDERTGKGIPGYYFASALNFRSVQSVTSASSVFLKLSYGLKSIVLGKNLKFSRVASVVNSVGEHSLFRPLPAGEKVTIWGQDFLPNKIYKVRIASDFQPAAITVNTTYESMSALNFVIPASAQDGSYSLSILEDDELVKRIPCIISSKPVTAIGQIWGTRTEYLMGSPAFMNTSRNILARGNSLFVSPFPALLGGMYQGYDSKKQLPQLVLTSAGKKIILDAKARGDASYADGSFVLYYGEYTIPADLPSGLYEVRMLNADKSETLPFWNKIEVK